MSYLCALLLAVSLMVRGPVITGVSHERAFITWETSALQTDAAVRYGTAPGAYDNVVRDGSTSLVHHVELTGLSPQTTVHFAVDSDAVGEDSTFTTAPLPGSSAPFKFAVYGDNRTQLAPHQAVVSAILSEPGVSFLVHTGDMADNTSAASPGWNEFFAIEHDLLRTHAIFPAIGNHETVVDGLSHFAQFFAAPTFSWPSNTVRYASYDWGRAHFVLLDTFESTLPGVNNISAAQVEWMKADLDAARAAGQLIFAVMHHGPYSHSLHGPNPQAQQLVVPELVARGARAIFQGHDHVYERGCSGGIDYLIAGGGGAPLYPVDVSGDGVQSALPDHSYVVVSVDGDRVTGEAKLVDGGVIDRFSLPSSPCAVLADAGAQPDGGPPPAAKSANACTTAPAATFAPLGAVLLAMLLLRWRRR